MSNVQREYNGEHNIIFIKRMSLDPVTFIINHLFFDWNKTIIFKFGPIVYIETRHVIIFYENPIYHFRISINLLCNRLNQLPEINITYYCIS